MRQILSRSRSRRSTRQSRRGGGCPFKQLTQSAKSHRGPPDANHADRQSNPLALTPYGRKAPNALRAQTPNALRAQTPNALRAQSPNALRTLRILVGPDRHAGYCWPEQLDSGGRVAEHWFPSLLHARTEIERWRREYNEERPKKALGGLTPTAYAKQLQ